MPIVAGSGTAAGVADAARRPVAFEREVLLERESARLRDAARPRVRLELVEDLQPATAIVDASRAQVEGHEVRGTAQAVRIGELEQFEARAAAAKRQQSEPESCVEIRVRTGGVLAEGQRSGLRATGRSSAVRVV